MPLPNTRLVKEIRANWQEPLEQVIANLATEHGVAEAARRLGIHRHTLTYWLIKQGTRINHIFLAPGDTIEIKKVSRKETP